MRAHTIKIARRTTSSKRDASDALQFAPNFTAYVLPPDVVCLYSEDRKFLLHGELYCALAAEIAKGRKSSADLARKLGKTFPADKVEEALKRLHERRYVVTASSTSDATVAGYWASLGLPPQEATKNLKACRVRVESIDVDGGKQLTSALRDLGVEIVERSPGLTVTLVSDYLERRLIEPNHQRISTKTPWLLVQPSGVFPLVGPVFKPGESACWTCLADRMIRNREIKGFLERGGAKPIAVSSLVRKTLGQGAIQFAAVEIAKAIATGFRTDLTNHILSFDLTGATIAKHYVPKRPQCPTCGNKKLQNPRRAPQPIEVDAGTKLIARPVSAWARIWTLAWVRASTRRRAWAPIWTRAGRPICHAT